MDHSWIKELEKYYKAGINNIFYLYGNTRDYANLEETFSHYVCRSLIDFGLVDVCKTSGIPSPSESRVAYVRSDSDIQTASYHCNTGIDHSDVHVLMVFIGEKLDQAEDTNSSVHTIEIPYPSEEERQEFIYQLIRREEARMEHLDKPTLRARTRFVVDQLTRGATREVNVPAFARLTAGLTRKQIEDAWLLCLSNGSFDYDLILERKQMIIRREFGDVIEIMDSSNLTLEDYSGQNHIKAYLKETVIDPIMNGNTAIVPKGLLFCGPPGTGKTYLANCLAGEGKVNFIELKMNKILDMWVGNSEKNFAKALTCIRSIYPVMVFVDEIDQAFQRGGDGSDGGSRVSGNIFGMFLSQLSDPKTRGKIVWIAATNYPNKLDEALKRTGRFDKKIPFLPPDEKDRAETFRILVRKIKNPNTLKEEEYGKLAEMTEGYVQSDIEQVVVKAMELMVRRQKKEMTAALLEEAVRLIVIRQNHKIIEMTDLAISECNDNELLPPAYRQEPGGSDGSADGF